MRTAWIPIVILLGTFVVAQSQSSEGQRPSSSEAVPGMDMSHSQNQAQDMHDMQGMGQGTASAMHSMESRHMDMGPHMKMTDLRPIQPGDKEKADHVAQAARTVAEKYKDYKVALADGFQIFLPNVPQKQYHFTNYKYAWEARNHFDPSLPTSLLYEKNGDGYKLIGVMYTAKKDASEDELNARVPLSIAQWHAHVNLCAPPNRSEDDVLPQSTKFGLRGSIATKEECDAAGGRFFPQVFGWMVHVYPLETKSEDIWSVERQNNHMD
jgi:hypothetical protein